MFTNTAIAFIGSGSMAEAMIAGLIAQKLIGPQSIVASGPRVDRGEQLRLKHGIRVTTNNREAIEGAGVVVLAAKPQILPAVMHELKGHIQPSAVVLSIIAGAKIETIGQG